MSSPTASSPSGAMLQAALGGLLCFAACGDPDASSTTGSGGGAPLDRTTASPSASTNASSTSGNGTGGGTSSESGTGGETSGDGGNSAVHTTGAGGTTSDGGATGDGGAGGGSTSATSSDATASSTTGVNPHTPIPNTACEDGQVPDPIVTSSEIVVLTQEDFEGICAEAGGIFEIQPLCGGSNACRGIAYDSGTHVLTEHTCQGTNTCAGYNCVVCES